METEVVLTLKDAVAGLGGRMLTGACPHCHQAMRAELPSKAIICAHCDHALEMPIIATGHQPRRALWSRHA